MQTYLPPVTLVLGGARSGKSRFAETLANGHRRGRAYLATAQNLDGEMAERIERHRADRGDGWKTIEEPLEIGPALVAATEQGDVLLVDCLTLWLTNLILADRDVAAATQDLTRSLRDAGGPVIFVSNEVGWGIVPDNALARQFRDAAGRLNQDVAAMADQVFLVAAGLPLRLK